MLPTVPPARRGWIGALTGLSLVAAVGRVAGVDAALKWPNDLLVDGAKCAGLLAEATADGVVVGFGLNVTLRRDEAAAAGRDVAAAGRSQRGWTGRCIAAAVLDDLAGRLDRWTAADGDPDRSGLRGGLPPAPCATLGSRGAGRAARTGRR